MLTCDLLRGQSKLLSLFLFKLAYIDAIRIFTTFTTSVFFDFAVPTAFGWCARMHQTPSVATFEPLHPTKQTYRTTSTGSFQAVSRSEKPPVHKTSFTSNKQQQTPLHAHLNELGWQACVSAPFFLRNHCVECRLSCELHSRAGLQNAQTPRLTPMLKTQPIVLLRTSPTFQACATPITSSNTIVYLILPEQRVAELACTC